MEIKSELLGDRAKSSLKDDAFGLDRIAKSIAYSLINRNFPDSYTIGIEGKWGSGKTSLTNFVINEIQQSDTSFHEIILYDPWLIGKRDGLLSEFFTSLISKIQDLVKKNRLNEKFLTSPKIIENLIKSIERYSNRLSFGSSALASAAPFDPSGATHVGAVILKILGYIAKFFRGRDLKLSSLRENIKCDLLELKRIIPSLRFTVVIDDLDRLDPEESIEVLRLIKSVADFPCVTYLVCFDRELLSKQIETVIKVGTGQQYIEKIFQNIISVPPQEPFSLRRFSQDLLMTRFPEQFSEMVNQTREYNERSEILFDLWVGKYIKTPRDAARLCNSVTLGWPSLDNIVDFFDYTWLQLIKIKCPELYIWVREYVVNIGSYRDGGRPGDQEPQQEARNLVKILDKLGWETTRDQASLANFLPGIASYTNNGNPKVFDLADGELFRYEKDRRLGSPSHWKLYFSFDAPTYAINDTVLSNFIRNLDSNFDKSTEIARELIEKPHRKSGYFLEILLERLYDRREDFSKKQEIGLARVLAEVMDDAPEPPGVHFGSFGHWRRALKLLTPSIGPYFAEMVATASSINWLASAIRDQGFSLGIIDTNRASPERQWLTIEQFNSARSVATQRFRELKLEGILQTPHPIEILFCWKQFGSESEFNVEISKSTKDDLIFVSFLDNLRTWVSSSDKGLYKPLRADVVSLFIDSDASFIRLKRISEGHTTDFTVKERAYEIYTAIDRDL